MLGRQVSLKYWYVSISVHGVTSHLSWWWRQQVLPRRRCYELRCALCQETFILRTLTGQVNKLSVRNSSRSPILDIKLGAVFCKKQPSHRLHNRTIKLTELNFRIGHINFRSYCSVLVASSWQHTFPLSPPPADHATRKAICNVVTGWSSKTN